MLELVFHSSKSQPNAQVANATLLAKIQAGEILF